MSVGGTFRRGADYLRQIVLPSLLTLEGLYVLFLFSGRFKGAAWLQWVPIDISALLLALACVSAVWVLMLQGWSVGKRGLLLLALIAAFTLWAVVSMAWSPSTVYASHKLFGLIVYGPLSLGIAACVIAQEQRRVERAMLIIVGFSLVMAFSGYLKLVAAGGYGFSELWGGNYLGVGRTLGMGALIGLVYAIRNRQHARRVWAVLAALLAAGVLLMGGRGPLLSVIVGVAVVLFGQRGDIDWKRARKWFPRLLAGTAVIVGVTTIWSLLQGVVPRFMYKFVVLFTQPGGGDSVRMRIEWYADALGKWLSAPLIGHGIGSWPIISGLGDTRAYPHNLILETGVEFGLVGVLLLAGLIAAGSLALLRSRTSRSLKVLIIALVVHALVNSMFSGDLVDNRVLFAVIGFMALSDDKPSVFCAGAVAQISTVHRSDDSRIVEKECRSLVESGHDVVLIIPGVDPRVEGVVHIALPRYRRRMARMTFGVVNATRLALSSRAQICHLHDPELLLAAPLLSVSGRTVIADIHELTSAQIMDKHWIPRGVRKCVARLYGVLEKLLLRACDAVIVAEPVIQQQLSMPGIFVVQNFPRVDLFECGSSLRSHDTIDLVYHGGINRSRGLIDMLDMLELLGATGWSGRLKLAGVFQPESLRAEAECHPGWRYVDYLGWLSREEVREVVCRAHVGLLPLHPTRNYVDSWPVKLFEYMSAGLPVVASSFPLWKEIINGAGCGLLVDSERPDLLAHAVMTLIEDQDLRVAMGASGKAAVQATYSWNSQQFALADAYDAAEKRRSRRSMSDRPPVGVSLRASGNEF